MARNALPHQKAILLEMAELWTNSVAEEITPQVSMMRAIQIRAPIRSRIRLLGTSKKK